MFSLRFTRTAFSQRRKLHTVAAKLPRVSPLHLFRRRRQGTCFGVVWTHLFNSGGVTPKSFRFLFLRCLCCGAAYPCLFFLFC